MSFETDGFLAKDWREFAENNLVTPETSALCRDLSRSIQRLVSEVKIVDADSPIDPRFVARLLILRALTNFQGAVILAEQGLGAEARTLARSCLETAFCLAGVLSKKEVFVDLMLKDSAKHHNELAKHLLSLEGDNAVNSELQLLLQDHLHQDKKGQWLATRSLADASDLSDLYIFYRELSADAHPTMISLLRYIEEDGDVIDFVWGPERDVSRVKEVMLLCCTFLVASGIAFNSEVAKNDFVGEDLGKHWISVQKLQGSGASESQNS
ncbi:DUF5677 domain-containing protein [Caulobacter sp. ErkDOM-E]|uniref:DUF5677 domain-containing protein n=1 Tax=Caulobacter sp. ErkDOM-E TaxID=3402778 RepID=UPI003AF6EE46